jgi:hypothetical protein
MRTVQLIMNRSGEIADAERFLHHPFYSRSEWRTGLAE